MFCSPHKELANGIDMVEVANLFMGENQQRKRLFGKFSENDPPMKSTFASKATQTVARMPPTYITLATALDLDI